MDPAVFARTSSLLGYAHNPLDRLANFRDDERFVETLRRQSSARVALIHAEAVLLGGARSAPSPWFETDAATGLGPTAETVFLGRDEHGARFAALLHGLPADTGADDGAVWTADLRALAVDGTLPGADLGALAEAKALLNWHARHRFCPNCGTPTHPAGAGWRRECPNCLAHHFPRTDPVVIMLATDGDRCLMGRQPRFPPGMYSCLAGFLEPGETIEAAVARELHEESGVTVGRVTYLGSQPWPFPSSLMVGCLAEATSTEVRPDHLELEDARWFPREEVAAMMAGTHPGGLVCPTPMAIAYHLVRAWMEGGRAS